MGTGKPAAGKAQAGRRRFWFKLRGKNRGPLSAEEFADLPGAGLDSPACPEGRDPRGRKNWKLARHFPELRAALAGPRGGQKLRRGLERFIEVLPAELPPSPPPTAEEVHLEHWRFPWARAAAVGAPLALLLVGLGLRELSRRPPPRPAPPRPSLADAMPERAVSDLLLPRCGLTIGQAVGKGSPLIAARGGRSFRVSFAADKRTGLGEVAFVYDAGTGALEPVSDGARRLLDPEQPCPSG